MANSAGNNPIALNVTSRILQSQQTKLTTAWSQATSVANTWYSVTDLAVTITPTSTTSKILLLGNVNVGISAGSVTTFLKIQRGGVDLTLGSGAVLSNMADCTPTTANLAVIPLMFLDVPATTSATTYQVFVASTDAASSTLQVNSYGADTNTSSFWTNCSNIIALEIQ